MGGKQKGRKRAALVLRDKLREEHLDWCVQHFPDEDPSAKRSPQLQKHHPYPGLVNLGNTCYLNAVCQVLFHCDAARQWFRNRMEADIAEDDSAALAQEMKKLAENLAAGFSTGLSEERSRVDIWSPHELLDKFLRCRPLALGSGD